MEIIFILAYLTNPRRRGDENELSHLKRNMNWMVRQISTREMELEQRVHERTLELQKTNSELEVAKKMADESVEIKNRFLANMSHEIRTPMNAILGLSDLLMNMKNSVKQLEYLKIIRSSSKSLLEIINDILDFSKIDAGQLELESVPFSIRSVVEEVTDIFGQSAGEKNIELIIDIDPQVPQKVQGDPLRTKQIITNLVSNALKFTKIGEVVIAIEMASNPEKDILLNISIKDTGIGMPPEVQQKIFQSFTQADISTTRKYGGTGLGLSICKQLVDLMEGRISVNSDKGKGSQFDIRLSFGACDCDASGDQRIPDSLKGHMIWVINQQKTITTVINRYLTVFGFQSRYFTSGSEALETLKKCPADQLPIMSIIDSGIKDIEYQGLIAESRNILSNQKFPIIYLSRSFFSEETPSTVMDESFFFLEKPVKQYALFNSIMKGLGCQDLRVNSSNESKCEKCCFDKLKVLVVEDNPVNQKVIREMLNSLRILSDVADTGNAALQKMDEKAYDLVFMDIQMDGLNGYQTTSKIRSNPKFETIPIIAMTANASAEDRKKALESGLNDHIPKPLDMEVLCLIISRWTAHNYKPNGFEMPEELLAIDSVAGIDVIACLNRMRGKPDTFFNVLNNFVLFFQDAINVISTSIQQKEFAQAKFDIHKLKGASGNISATRLHDLVSELESAVINKEPDEINRLLKECQADMIIVIQSIQELLDQRSLKDVSNSHSDLSIKDLSQQVLNLDEMLKRNSLDAKETMLNLRSSLQNSISDESVKQLETATRTFNFKEARKALASINTQLQHKLQDSEISSKISNTI